ncbi:GyrI-like domain-containing protein [Dysgonomonas sp. GY75]|uniref:GyrI-like domain-containing protein n=1 Tax=Dysgonomonas sp. GY75 TaxID=2780419 RepID=UPI001883EC91|nr:GyrI-like domain-containing protein [Dysgonomonas sp. GY75]MBF0651605.1 GyrI-like domain-containing protein [Dysgonomonas sp. GY75]
MPRMSNVELLRQREQPILCIKVKTNLGELPSIIGRSFARMAAYLKELGEQMTDVPFVAFPDYENMDEDNMLIQVGFPVSKKLPEKEDIKPDVIPEGKIAFCMYRGSYAELMPVYEDMIKWIKENGFESAGISYEYYYNGIEYPESEYLTKIVIALK